MQIKYSYEKCYQILNTKPDCDWHALRRKYKIQIQKWHPDRFEEGSTKKDAAEEKIKELNNAFQQLSKYYQKNKTLPRIEKNQSKTIEQNPTKTRPKPSPYTQHQKSGRPEKNSLKDKTPARVTILAGTIALIYFCFGISTDDNSKPFTTKKLQPIQNQQLEYNKKTTTEPAINTHLDNEIAKSKSIDLKQFTYGSTIGDVIMIQGPPTKIVGDTWYYGESKIYFHKGIVKNWERKLGSPLHASIYINKAEPNN